MEGQEEERGGRRKSEPVSVEKERIRGDGEGEEVMREELIIRGGK